MEIHDCPQNSDSWLQARCGIPTSSEFKNILTSQGKTSTSLGGYAATLAADAYHGMPLERWEGNRATERGHELEAGARAAYEFLQDADVIQVGFVTGEGSGCSPDGLVGDDGLAEFKCLMPKGHVEVMAYINKHNKCPPAYYPQVQGQMLICERAWCDLFFYHPDLPHIQIRVDRNDEYIQKLRDHIVEVCAKRDELLQMLEAA